MDNHTKKKIKLLKKILNMLQQRLKPNDPILYMNLEDIIEQGIKKHEGQDYNKAEYDISIDFVNEHYRGEPLIEMIKHLTQ